MFCLGLQSFTRIDEPYIFQVDFENKKIEPIDNTNNEEFQNIDEIIPEYMVSATNTSIESRIRPVATKDDFSFHKKETGVYRSLRSQKCHSIMTLEGETSDTVGIGNEDMDMPTLNASEDSSDDESYDENDNSDSRDDDDDILIGAVNVKDVNMRQYGKPKSTAYSVENMITAVKNYLSTRVGCC